MVSTTSASARQRFGSERGFSLIEMLFASALLVTLAGMAMLATPSWVASTRADSAGLQAFSILNIARERAVAERRTHEVRFVSPNIIRVVRIEVPGPTETTVLSVTLEGRQEFRRFTGVPDTPDAFGGTGALAFGSAATTSFSSEGTFVDNAGDVLNGTVFLGVPDDVSSARALTIFGATAQVKLWRWNGSAWVE